MLALLLELWQFAGIDDYKEESTLRIFKFNFSNKGYMY